MVICLKLGASYVNATPLSLASLKCRLF